MQDLHHLPHLVHLPRWHHPHHQQRRQHLQNAQQSEQAERAAVAHADQPARWLAHREENASTDGANLTQEQACRSKLANSAKCVRVAQTSQRPAQREQGRKQTDNLERSLHTAYWLASHSSNISNNRLV